MALPVQLIHARTPVQISIALSKGSTGPPAKARGVGHGKTKRSNEKARRGNGPGGRKLGASRFYFASL